MKPLDNALRGPLNDFVTQWFTNADGSSRWYFTPKNPFRFEAEWTASQAVAVLQRLLIPASEMIVASDIAGWLTTNDLSDIVQLFNDGKWRDELYVFQTPYDWLVAMTPRGVMLQGKATKYVLRADGTIGDSTPEHLFRFSYKTPEDFQSNDRYLADRETSQAFVVVADDAAAALAWGAVIANDYVRYLFAKAGVAKGTSWRQDRFRFALEDKDAPYIAKDWYAKLARVRHGESPDFATWG